jgi:hypothetical protein
VRLASVCCACHVHWSWQCCDRSTQCGTADAPVKWPPPSLRRCHGVGQGSSSCQRAGAFAVKFWIDAFLRIAQLPVYEPHVHVQMLELNLHCPMHLTRQVLASWTHSGWHWSEPPHGRVDFASQALSAILVLGTATAGTEHCMCYCTGWSHPGWLRRSRCCTVIA